MILLFCYVALCICIWLPSRHPERAILLRVERGARHEVSGSRIKSCYPLVDPVLRTPLRGSTSLRSAQVDTREYGRAQDVR